MFIFDKFFKKKQNKDISNGETLAQDENALKNANSNENAKNSVNDDKKYIKKSLLDKLDKKIIGDIKDVSIFEKVNDARSLFLIERAIKKNTIFIAFFFFCTTIVCLILIVSLFPLKEKEPYLVAFSNATQNFVTIEKADKTITSNESLIRSLIGAYVLNRETINHIDDTERFNIIKEQSSPKVWNTFEAIIAQEQSIYTNPNLRRDIKIVNIGKWKNGYANVEVIVTLTNTISMSLESEKRYRIIVVYKFVEQKISYDNISVNPTGFSVIDYAITLLETIKELDFSQRVDSKKSKSRIIDSKRNNPLNSQIEQNQKLQQQTNSQNFNAPRVSGHSPSTYTSPNPYEE